MGDPAKRTLGCLAWLRERGGYWNEYVGLHEDASFGGISPVAIQTLPRDSKIVECPLRCCITPDLAIRAVEELGHGPETIKQLRSLEERVLVCLFVVLHLIAMEKGEERGVFDYGPYITSLPLRGDILTPLHWQESELNLLQGTNLYFATLDRRRSWEKEIAQIHEIFRSGSSRSKTDEWVSGLSPERYVHANTILSSRAFPSTLLDPSTTALTPQGVDVSSSTATESHPILVPGLDILNHQTGARVAWRPAQTGGSEHASPSQTTEDGSCICLTLDGEVEAGEKVYNNYGPKNNESLILGYGFALPDNPHDTCLVKLGDSLDSGIKDLLAREKLDPSASHVIGRDGEIPQDLWKILRLIVSQGSSTGDDSKTEDAELELEVANTLADMIESKLIKMGYVAQAVQDAEVVENGGGGTGRDDEGQSCLPTAGVRKEVFEMCQAYVKGQVEILQTTYDKLMDRIEALEDSMQ